VFVPLLREGRGLGALVLTHPRPGFRLKPAQRALLETFAAQALIAIENARLLHEIREKTRQLEVASRHKSEFLANMSHELRTPLNAVIGFAEALRGRMVGEVNDKQAEYLDSIRQAGEHLLALINDVLDLSKVEAGRMELALARVDLPQAIHQAMTQVRPRALREGIALAKDIDPHLREVEADERKLRQILLNLLSNAVKYTPGGGRVEVCALPKGEFVEISVKDTGAGITPEDQSRLFEMFGQVGGDGERKAEGTGLGLALTKRLVELHGGKIAVDSAPGKGSTFRVTLPVRH
jgi:signal transduction histidine kinase